MLTYQNAPDAPNRYDLVPQSLPWILEAGNPYYDWLFGDAQLTMRILDAWMRRASSEVSILRVRILMCDAEVAGGFIALDGLELKRARRADAVALITAVSGADRAGLIRRLTSATDLFSPVDDDEYYLSKMGLHSRFRGKGYGRELLDRYINEGNARGYVRYRLDVHADNIAAIRRYQGFGFQIADRARTRDGSLEYYSMRYQLEHR